MSESTKQLQSLRRAIQILRHLSSQPGGASFSAISELFPDSPPSTVTRLLRMLSDEGLIDKPAGQRLYYLGQGARDFAKSILCLTSLEETLQPLLDDLMRQSGESAALFTFTGDAVELKAKAESPEAFHYMSVGGTNTNFHDHGFAKMCLSWQDKTTRSGLLKTAKPKFGKSLKAADIQIIRESDVLVNTSDDKKGVCRIVSPILLNDGEFIGAIGISFFESTVEQGDIKKYSEMVSLAAKQGTMLLGPIA